MMFHINNDGNPGACRAKVKCPFGDVINDHFESEKAARENYELKEETLVELEGGEFRPHSVTDHAIASTLVYEKEIPDWFKEDTDEAKRQYELFGTTSELLDVFTTESERKIAVIFEPWSVREQDIASEVERGFQISRTVYKDYKTGETLGYLNTSNITQASLNRSYGIDGWEGMRYVAETYSFHGLEVKYGERKDKVKTSFTEYYPSPLLEENTDESHEYKVKFIEKYEAYVISSGDYSRGRSKDLKLKTHEELNQIIENCKTHSNEKMQEKVGHFKDQPFVDFSRLGDELKGTGLASSLYIYSAKRLAQDGYSLRGSGIQSDDAKTLWQRLFAHPKLNTSLKNRARRVSSGEKKVSLYPYLDFNS